MYEEDSFDTDSDDLDLLNESSRRSSISIDFIDK